MTMTRRGHRSAWTIAYSWHRVLETISSVSKANLDMQECSKSGKELQIEDNADKYSMFE